MSDFFEKINRQPITSRRIAEAVGFIKDRFNGLLASGGGELPKMYPLNPDKSGVKCIETRLQEFASGERGIAIIPKGIDVSLRKAVVAETYDKLTPAFLSRVASLRHNQGISDDHQGIIIKRFNDGPQDSEYINEILLDYQVDRSGFPKFSSDTLKDGLTKPQLEAFLACCDANMQIWRLGGCREDLKSLIPVVRIIDSDGMELALPMRTGLESLPLMENNQVI